MNNVNTGKIVQISGPVIDVQFESGVLPKIREALSLTVDGRRYVMEVAQHVGDNTVRCVMLSGSEGLSRGMHTFILLCFYTKVVFLLNQYGFPD